MSLWLIHTLTKLFSSKNLKYQVAFSRERIQFTTYHQPLNLISNTTANLKLCICHDISISKHLCLFYLPYIQRTKIMFDSVWDSKWSDINTGHIIHNTLYTPWELFACCSLFYLWYLLEFSNYVPNKWMP